jgi:hypothetical protein
MQASGAADVMSRLAIYSMTNAGDERITEARSGGRNTMRGVKAPDYIRKFVAEEKGNVWKIRFWSEIMGYRPIGSRLGKGSLPKLDLSADNHADAVLLCNQWNKWYQDNKCIRTSSKASSSRS